MAAKTISPSQYYLAMAHFIIACDAQKTVRKSEEQLERILQDENIGDTIYDPATDGSKEAFDNVLLKAGIQIDWLKRSKKDKTSEKEKNHEQK